MFKKRKSSYSKGSVETFFRKFGSNINAISKDPLNEENIAKIRFPFFPLKWDVNQTYFIVKQLFKTKLFDDTCFIITNRDYSKIHEIMMVKYEETDEEEIGTGQPRCTFKLIPYKMRKHQKTVKQLTEYVKNFDVKVFKFLENFLKDPLNGYHFDLGHLLIVPEHIAQVGVLEETDYINSDLIRYLKDFIKLMRKGIIELKKLPVVDYSSKENRSNPFVNIFIKFAREWGNVEINKYFDFLTSMLETLSLNLLVFDENNKPILISRINIENKTIHFNPVPLTFLKKYFLGEEGNIKEITRELYSYTKTQTISLKIKDFIELLYKFNNMNYSFASSLLDIIQYIFNSNIYPESIIITLLSSLGIDYKKAMPRLKDAFIEFIKYYGRILIATLVVKPQGKRELYFAFSVSIENGELNYDQIAVDEYKELFDQNKTPVAIDLFKKNIESNTNLKFPFIMVIKMKELMEIFSFKNLTSIIEMSKFMKSLPSIEKITELMKSISIGEKFSEREEEINENAETLSDQEQEGLIEWLPALNHFLSKGITLKIEEGKSFIFSRDSSYSGHLGLDIKKIKQFIKDRFPDILK